MRAHGKIVYWRIDTTDDSSALVLYTTVSGPPSYIWLLTRRCFSEPQLVHVGEFKDEYLLPKNDGSTVFGIW